MNPNHHSSRRFILIAIIVVAILLLSIILLGFINRKSDDSKGSQTSDAAANRLYGALSNAASQPRLQVAMYRETFANKADADARRNQGSIASSVSELDTTTARYRSVFAHNYFHAPGFDVGRCIDGVTYNQDYDQVAKGPRATSLKDNIARHLARIPEGHLYQVTQQLSFIPCPRLGLIPNTAADLATARLSDGIFPVTLSTEQAAAWQRQLTAANLFTVRDEGSIQHKGQAVRKFNLMPRQPDGVNKQLFDIFYAAAEIEKIKDKSWQHGFISINPANTGSVGGYYLIDEKTNLPVYSELYGTNPDKLTGESNAAGKNIARTKQSYRFPSELTITLDTPLEFLE